MDIQGAESSIFLLILEESLLKIKKDRKKAVDRMAGKEKIMDEAEKKRVSYQ